MNTMRVKTVEGRRLRDPANPKIVIPAGAVLDVSRHDIFWTRRLRDGDVVEVLRRVKLAEGRKLAAPTNDPKKPEPLVAGKVYAVSQLDDFWALALDRGDVVLAEEPEAKKPDAPVSAAAPAAPANDGAGADAAGAKPRADK